MQHVKSFNIKMSKDLWVFLKNESARTEKSMRELIESCISKMRDRIEKKRLTKEDADI